MKQKKKRNFESEKSSLSNSFKQSDIYNEAPEDEQPYEPLSYQDKSDLDRYREDQEAPQIDFDAGPFNNDAGNQSDEELKIFFQN